jgi:hypothetical protein
MKKAWLYEGAGALIVFVIGPGAMIRRAITAPAETVGERLRRECESIVDTAYPPANPFQKFTADEADHPDEQICGACRVREFRVRECVMRRGQAGR